MYTFKQFMMNAQKQKRCPDGYRFDKALNVCVPIGVTRYYPYFGGRGNGDQQTDTSNDNGQNGNGANGKVAMAMAQVAVTETTLVGVTDHENI